MKKEIKYVVLICFCIQIGLFVACKNQFDAPISEQKLVEILVDVHTAEAVTETEKQEVRDSMNSIYYTQIFEHHGIKKKDFDSTMAIYARNPERFDTVYSRVERLIKGQKDTLINRQQAH